jgi:Domain of unknown function (DUF4124)
MNLNRVWVLGALWALSLSATAQWQWTDASGRKVYSDRPPPSDVPAKSILKQPGPRTAAPATTGAPAADAPPAQDGAPAAGTPAAPATAAAAPAKPGVGGLKISGKDAELEAKKKQAEQAEVTKKKADEEKFVQAKAQNCERARRAMTTLQSGVRIQQTNAKGEREFLDDAGRAAETRRLQGVVAADCK